jgi:hypothetical protein
MAKLEDVIKRDTNASRPAAGTAGRIYIESDTGELYYDTGSSWVLMGSIVGEIAINAEHMTPSTTSGSAALAQTEYTTNDIDLRHLAFDASTDEFAQVGVWMPDDYDGGTITFKAIWTAASGSGDVVWGLQGRAYADDDAIDQAWGTAQTITDTLTATNDLHITSASSAITLAGTPAGGQYVQLRVYRDADNVADTLAADARLLSIKVYFTRS